MKKETCTIAVNNFPRTLWTRYAAWVKSNGDIIKNHLEYLLLKTLREAGVDFPQYHLQDLIKKLKKK